MREAIHNRRVYTRTCLDLGITMVKSFPALAGRTSSHVDQYLHLHVVVAETPLECGVKVGGPLSPRSAVLSAEMGLLDLSLQANTSGTSRMHDCQEGSPQALRADCNVGACLAVARPSGSNLELCRGCECVRRLYAEHHITLHPMPYIARSTSRRTWYQSARRSANS